MGADIKAVRARIKSVDSTRHITRAMGLAASAKIRRATEKMDKSKYYKSVMLDAFSCMSNEKSRYTCVRERNLPVLYVVIAGDRGLAGGYNINIFRSASAMLRDIDVVLPIGGRAVEHFKRMGCCVSEEYSSCEKFTEEDCAHMSVFIRDMYDRGEIAAVNLISAKYVSAMSQVPDITYILPIGIKKEIGESENENKKSAALIEYEPSAAAVMESIIPDYIAGIVYSSVCEAFAAELAARRSAMDTAAKNADEMMSELSLKYNRARQGAITQEITEIVAGANA